MRYNFPTCPQKNKTMSPEAKKVPGLLGEIFKQFGPKVPDLKDNAMKLTDSGRYAEAMSVLSELTKAQEFEPELKAALVPLSEFIDKWLPSVFIPDSQVPFLSQSEVVIDHVIPEIKEPEAPVSHPVTDKPTEIKKSKKDKPAKTEVENVNYTHLALALVLDKNEDGTFKYSYQEVLTYLAENAHISKKVAEGRMSFAKSYVGTALIREAKQSGLQTVGEVCGLNLKTIKSPSWRKFYETALTLYGDMSPNDFVEKVLTRFKAAKKSKQSEIPAVLPAVDKPAANTEVNSHSGKTASITEQAEATVINRLITLVENTPLTEVMIAGRLADPKVLEELKKVLGKDPFKVANYPRKNFEQKMDASRLRAAEKRLATLANTGLAEVGPTAFEDKKAREIIRDAVRSMNLHHESWRVIQLLDENEGWKFVYELTNCVGCADDLLLALFPKINLIVDVQDFVQLT
jgi:hypothetical protein